MKVLNTIRRVGHSENKKAELIRFGVTGAIATFIQYGFYYLFVAVLNIPAVGSSVISYVLSFSANFFLSNFFTFHTSPTKKKAASFTVSHLINLGLQTGLVALFSRIIDPEYALLPAMGICIPCNFLLVRFALKSSRFE